MSLPAVNEDTDIQHLDFPAEEIPCDNPAHSDRPATHVAILGCTHSFMVCEECTANVRKMSEITKEALCAECEQLTHLVALNPIHP